MKSDDIDTIDSLTDNAQAIAADAMEILFELKSDLRARYDERLKRSAREDMAHHVRHLAAIAFSSGKGALVDYLSWLKVLFDGIGLPDELIALSFRCVGRAGARHLDGERAERFRDIAERAAREYGRSEPATNRYLKEGLPDNGIARAYVQAVIDGRRDLAESMVKAEEAKGTRLGDLYLELFQPAQREIGRLWHLRKISVAQEHFASAITQFIMSELYPRLIADSRPNGKRAIAACAQGELHELGIRMVADFLQADGWDTRFLGANLPVDALIQEIERTGPDLVALSASVPTNVHWIERAVLAIRKIDGRRPAIMAGGIPFLVSPELWKEVGADGTAIDCRQAVGESARIVAGRAAGS